MCRISLISDNIVRLSTRSYKQRIEAMGMRGNISSQLNRLNHDLDKFYELLHKEWYLCHKGCKVMIAFKAISPFQKRISALLKAKSNGC